MDPIVVHTLCVALVAADFVLRAWRTQCFLLGLRQPLAFRTVFLHGLLGEAASSLTPLRMGGEPARAWAMRDAGVTAMAAVVCVSVELLATLVVIGATAVVVGIVLAPDWWSVVGPGVMRTIIRQWPWIIGVGVAMLLAWWIGHRLLPDAARAIRGELAAAREHAREIPLWPYVASVPLSVANIAVRVAILPLLAMTLTNPPPVDATVTGSFVLLYSQGFLPTPAGAGAVELGFLGGAVGEFGAEEATLLFYWRLYTTAIGLVLGVMVALRLYGWRAIPRALQGARKGMPPPEGPPL